MKMATLGIGMVTLGIGVVTLGTACQEMDNTQSAAEAAAHSMHKVSGTEGWKVRFVSHGRIHVARNWSAGLLGLRRFVLRSGGSEALFPLEPIAASSRHTFLES